ncbi:MAG: hypothetical protein AAGK37_14810 [Pseudomonadota bacterium]
MADGLPDYYFRVRENGAQVFRVDTENRDRRLELEPIAVVNAKRGDWKPQGDRVLSEKDEAAIRDWTKARQAALTERTLDDIRRTVDHLNLTAGWAQSQATPAELDAITDELLLAMHDLRSVLVRRKAERLR